MKIDDEEVKYLAELSALSLDDEEVEEFKRDLESMLDFAGQISKVQTPQEFEEENIVSMQSLREDVPQPSMPRDEILKNAPKTRGEFFNVPKVVD